MLKRIEVDMNVPPRTRLEEIKDRFRVYLATLYRFPNLESLIVRVHDSTLPQSISLIDRHLGGSSKKDDHSVEGMHDILDICMDELNLLSGLLSIEFDLQFMKQSGWKPDLRSEGIASYDADAFVTPVPLAR